ncbi:MAG: hypothetical protein ACI4XW_03985 [Candidatus Spyradocola sp.]
MKRYVVPGLILILTGVFFLVEALPGVDLPFGAFLALLGAAMLIGRVCSRGRYGLSISGFLLLCLGLSWTLLNVLDIPGKYVIVATPLAVSLAFFLVHIFEFRRVGNWPMIPALALLAFSVVFFLILTPEVNRMLKDYYAMILPAILILIGIGILIRGAGRGRRERSRAYRAQPEPQPGDPSTWAQPPLHEQPQEEPAAQEPVTEEPVIIEPAPVQQEAPAQEPADGADAEEYKKEEL